MHKKTYSHTENFFLSSETKKLIKAIFNDSGYLETVRITPIALMVEKLKSFDKEYAIMVLRKKLYSPLKEESLISARILSKLMILEAIPDYIELIKNKKTADILYLAKALFSSLQEIELQKQVFQNVFHQEGDVYEHSKLVGKTSFLEVLYFTCDDHRVINSYTNKMYETKLLEVLDTTPVYLLPKINTSLETTIDGISRAKLLVIAAFLHDIGKYQAAMPKIDKDNRFMFFKTSEGQYIQQKFSDHESLGADIFLAHSSILKFTEAQRNFIYTLIKWHKEITDVVSGVRKFSGNKTKHLQNGLIGVADKYKEEGIFYEALLLFLADSFGKTGKSSSPSDIEELISAFLTMIEM